MPEWDRKVSWTNELSEAEHLRVLGDLEAAREILERIVEEAQAERLSHELGTAERGACTDILARAIHLLGALRRLRGGEPRPEE